MSLKEIANHIQYSDLSDGMKLLAERTDIDTVRMLIAERPYETIYIPNIASFRPAHKRYIAEKMRVERSLNLRQIAYQLNMSVRYLQSIIKEVYEDQAAATKAKREAAAIHGQ